MTAPDRSGVSFDRRAFVGGITGALAGVAVGGASATPATQTGQAHVQAVVSTQALATDAGVAMLRRGGTAADAAVAVAAALSVVEPWFSSALGGEVWALYYDAANGVVTSLDGVGPIGSKATLEAYAPIAGVPGMHQAIMPGAWDGWMRWLDTYGRLGLDEVLEPAIGLAIDGFAISPEMGYWLQVQADRIFSNPYTASVYAPDGYVPGVGQIQQQIAMGSTYRALADAFAGGSDRKSGIEAARDYFYRGPIAESIVAFSDEWGGYLTLDDFAGFSAEIVEPIAIDWNESVRIYQNPPNSQGIAMLMALNILKGFDFGGLDPDDPDAIHLQVEAIKLAYADRYFHVGDPARIDVPVEMLLSEEHAADQRDRIDFGSAMRWPIESTIARTGVTNTTTFHVVDGEGNCAAVTTSLGGQFYVAGDTGIVINERMRFLSLEPENANVVTPGYKVRHTSCPYLALRNGRPYLLGGNSGVDTQPQGQTQQVINAVEFGLTAQEAIDRPRFVSTAFPASTYPHATGNRLQMEAGFPDGTIQNLLARGHDIVVGEGIFGYANMIHVRSDGLSARAGAEPRATTSKGVVIRPS